MPRLSVNINDETAAALRRIAKRDGITYTEAVRRSVGTHIFFLDMQDEGREISVGRRPLRPWEREQIITLGPPTP